MARLLEGDLTQAMNGLEALKQRLARSPVQDEFQRLEKYMEGFSTDTALKSIERIVRSLDITL
jgi:hypothetical protein